MKRKQKKDEFVVFVKPFNDGGTFQYKVGTIAQKTSEREGYFCVIPSGCVAAVWVPNYCFKSNVWPEV